ncbi:MAG: GMC family oxidoreductase [Deltaproteobacteria bacterium]|nr:GMC family oxidoreductase [Deltaproteobacteria bacterium]
MASWDVVVVGAGAAGCVLADALADTGCRVALVEAGPRLPAGARAPEVDRRAWGFRATAGSFDWYRVRAVGGRSLLWGGWSYRFPAHVLRRAGWPVSAATMARWYRAAERAIGVVEGPLDPRVRRAARALEVRAMPKRAPLVGDRIWTALDTRSARRARTHTVALRLEHERGEASALDCLDLRTGKSVRIRGRAYVLAASPVETTRILLESEVPPRRAYGRDLVDHQVASYVLIERVRREPTGGGPLAGSALIDPGVNGPGVNGPGVDTDAASARPYRGGFTIEVSGPHRLDDLGIERMVPGDEVDEHRATMLHAIGEVFPSPRRFVELQTDDRDAYGRRNPRIHFAWTREDARRGADMKRACVAFGDEIAAPGSRLVQFVDPMSAGAGHEAGTAARQELVDDRGGLRALSNVWIADASVMPTSGDRHPTLTLLAHALRVAAAIPRALR